MGFVFRGEIAQAGAWFGRAADLIEKSGRDCVESGYLLIPVGLGQLEGNTIPTRPSRRTSRFQRSPSASVTPTWRRSGGWAAASR